MALLVQKSITGLPKTHPDGKPRPDAEPEIWFEKGNCDFNSFKVGVAHVDASLSERASLWYESPLCTGCCFLTTGKLLEETGGVDEGFFAYFEDVDLSLKIRAKGLLCAIIPSATSWHKVGQSTIKDTTPGWVFYCARNNYHLAERHAKRPEEWAAFRRKYPRHVMGLSGYLTKNMNAVVGATFLQGYLYAMRGHKGVRPKQKPGIVLKSVARVFQGIYMLKHSSRGKSAEPLPTFAGNPPA